MSSSSVACMPSSSTTNAFTVSPVYGCLSPTTAASSDLGVSDQRFLDLGRKHVETGDDDQVAFAVDEVDEAFLVADGDVTRSEPSVQERCSVASSLFQ